MGYNETPTTKVKTMFKMLHEANLKFFHNHPIAHLLITAVYGMLVGAGIIKMAEKIAQSMIKTDY